DFGSNDFSEKNPVRQSELKIGRLCLLFASSIIKGMEKYACCEWHDSLVDIGAAKKYGELLFSEIVCNEAPEEEEKCLEKFCKQKMVSLGDHDQDEWENRQELISSVKDLNKMLPRYI